MAECADAFNFERQQFEPLASKPEAQLSRAQRELVAAYRSNQAAEQLLLYPDHSPRMYGKLDKHKSVQVRVGTLFLPGIHSSSPQGTA